MYPVLQRLARPESWLALLLITVLPSPDGLRWLAGIGLSLTVASLLVRTRRFMRAATIGAGLVSLLGLTNMALGTVNAAYWGNAALLGLPVALSVGLTARGRRWQAAGQSVFLLSLLCIAASGSVGAWLGACAGVGVFVALWKSAAGERAARPFSNLAALTVGMSVSLAAIAGLLTLQNVPPPLPTPFLFQSFYAHARREIGTPGLLIYVLALLTLAGRATYFLRRGRKPVPGSREGLAAATLALLAGHAVSASFSPAWAEGALALPFWLMAGAGMASLSRPDTAEEACRHNLRPPRLVLAGATALLLCAFVGITAQETVLCPKCPSPPTRKKPLCAPPLPKPKRAWQTAKPPSAASWPAITMET